MKPLTQRRLKEILEYDPETGRFSWRVRASNSLQIGDRAGSLDGKGYILIRIDGRRYQASRLAFLWMTGAWPKEDAEHWDGKPENNRWKNLRDATVSQNMQNKSIQSNNKSGLKGVWKHNLNDGSWSGKWRSKIKAGAKTFHLGLSDCPVAAHLSYVVAADIHFGEFARSS